MPVAPIDQQGSVLFYEDSGPPQESQDYLTIVIIHGFVYHGGIFRRLLPFTTEKNVRVIRVNLRDYPGSSRFTPEELAGFSSDDPADQSAAVCKLGVEMIAFLDCIITTHEIPPISVEGGTKRGGISVLAWSYANIVSLSMLAHASSSLATTKNDLTQYLRTVVLYDASVTTIGAKPAAGLYHPLRDMTLTLEERGKRFEEWVCWYSTPVSDLETMTEDTLATRKPLHVVPPGAKPDPSTIPTLLRMSTDEFTSCTDPGIVTRSYASMRQVKPSVFAQNLRKALFDTNGVWPDIEVLVLWCDSTTGDALWAAKSILDMTSAKEPGEVARHVRFAKIPSLNHFGHWDYPETFTRHLLQHLQPTI